MVDPADRERRMMEGRYALTRLCAEGVSLRNEATAYLDGALLVDWKGRAARWNLRTVQALRKIDERIAERLSILDFEAESCLEGSQYAVPHSDQSAMHVIRLTKLREIIYELWNE